jgi:Arc/MetJ-type ribon-helix-helix transcriptional regulator
MKMSVSLPAQEVAFIDEYASRTETASRPAVIHAAIALLRAAELEDEYAAAFEECAAAPGAVRRGSQPSVPHASISRSGP